MFDQHFGCFSISVNETRCCRVSVNAVTYSQQMMPIERQLGYVDMSADGRDAHDRTLCVADADPEHSQTVS